MAGLTVELLSAVISFILITGGLIAILLPFAPSIPTIWFGIFVYAISHHFDVVTRNFLALITIIALFTIFLDYTLSRSGVQKIRAGGWGIAGAAIGFFIGSFFGSIVQFIIGPVLGAIIGESLHGRDQVFAFKTGNYTVVAFMGGTIIKLVAAIIMIGLFFMRLQGKV